MAIPYKIVTKTVLDDLGNPKTRYHLQATEREMVGVDELCRLISRNCTVSAPDIVAVLEALVEEIPYQLQDGKSVQLGKLGTFSAHISSDGMDRPELVNSTRVRKINVAFRASKRLKEAIKQTKVEPVKKGKLASIEAKGK